MPRLHVKKRKTGVQEKNFPKLSLLITTEKDGKSKITELRYHVTTSAQTVEEAMRLFWEQAKKEAAQPITNDLDTTGVAEKLAAGEIAVAVTVSNEDRVKFFQDVLAQEEMFKRKPITEKRDAPATTD